MAYNPVVRGGNPGGVGGASAGGAGGLPSGAQGGSDQFSAQNMPPEDYLGIFLFY